MTGLIRARRVLAGFARCIAVDVGMVINFFGAEWLFKWTDDVE